MAFQFPEDKQDFKAPNGITYTYYDGAWMVKTFGSKVPDPLTYRIQTDKVLRAGEPAIELVDSEGYFSNVKFEADGLIAVGSNAASIVVSSEQIEEKYDTAHEKTGEELQVHRDQINLLETQIQLLAQAQVVGRWNYVRNVSNGPRPPAPQTFYATNASDSSVVIRDWADARLLMISKTDLKDTTYTFTNFEEGDKIEILAVDGSSACYGTVTNDPNQQEYGNLIIAVERSTSGPRDDVEYILSIYRPGAVSGDVDLEVLDGRYLKRTGGWPDGLMTGNVYHSGTANQIMTNNSYIRFGWGDRSTVEEYGGYIYQRDESVFEIGAYSGITLKFVGDPLFDKSPEVPTPTLDPHAANKFYVDNQIGALESGINLDNYLPLSGGTLTNSLKIQRGEEKTHPQYKISPNGGSDYATNIYTLEGQMRFRTTHNNSESDAKGSHIVLDPDVANNGANPSTKIWKLPAPSSNDMAANKKYVDDTVAGYKVATGTNTNPSLAAGQMYLNTQNNTLYIGK